MSDRHSELLIEDIQTSIVRILEYTNNISFEFYENDSKTKDAV